MEFCKSLFAVLFLVAAMSSLTWTAPLSYRPSDTEIVIRLSLMPTRGNATKEMLKLYQFIASNWDLKETPLALGVADTPVCSSSLEKKDNLSIAFIQLYNFIHPLYLAYSYEEAKGPQQKVLASALKDTSFHLNNTVWRARREEKKDNLSIAFIQLYNFIHPLYLAYSYEEAKGPQQKVLASALKDTSFHLNNTVWRARREIKKTGSSIPTVQHISEASLDHHTKTYLQAMVNNKRVSLTITDDVVKIYRNYVILYTLKDVLIDVLTCI